MLKGHMFLSALSSLTALTIYTAISVADILFPSTSKIEIANKDANIGAEGVSKSSEKTSSYMEMFDEQDFASLDIFIDEDLPISYSFYFQDTSSSSIMTLSLLFSSPILPL